MSTDYLIEDVLPHSHPMILIERILEYGELYIKTMVTISEATPFIYQGKVPSYVSIEYMAQSVAAYSGINQLKSGNDIQVGFLLGTQKLELYEDSFNVGDLIELNAERHYYDGEMASFHCQAARQGTILAKANISVYQPINAASIITDILNEEKNDTSNRR